LYSAKGGGRGVESLGGGCRAKIVVVVVVAE
jgi:hypothetical protein